MCNRVWAPALVLFSAALPAADAPRPAIFQAMRNNDLALIKSEIAAGAVNVRGERGATPLICAAACDGSWRIKSRAVKFQPYFQSGFPYDHDQWISTSGSAWATAALALGLPERPATVAALR